MSINGDVLSLAKTANGKMTRILKQAKSGRRGDLSVALYSEAKRLTTTVSRLVANVFLLGRSAEKWQVHHKDYDPTNNKVENLEWVTPKYNVDDSYAQGTHKSRMRAVMYKGIVYPSIKAGAEALGIVPNGISKSCKRPNGKWSYVVGN